MRRSKVADPPVVKALVIEDSTRASTAFTAKEADVNYRTIGDTIPPPYDFEALVRIVEQSYALPPCIQAYETNLGGSFGFRLVPKIDLRAKDIDRLIWRDLVLEKLSDGVPPIVSDEDVRVRKLEIELEAEIEKARLDLWFENLASGMSFLELCRRRVRAQEQTGNAWWEIMRDDRGEPARIKHLPATSMRFTPLSDEPVEIWAPQRVSFAKYKMVREHRRVRRYVQLSQGAVVTYFKEFGDRRVMSADSGKVFPSIGELRAVEGDKARIATEVYHFDQLSTEITDYGVPRWIGATFALYGSREAEETNYLYFANQAIPEVVITVAGGKPADDLKQQVVNYLRERKGGQMRWSPLVLTAESAGAAMTSGAAGSQARINVIPLRTGMGSDAMFQEYENANARKVQQQFRLPDLLVGRSEESNKAQADAARAMTEEQVFTPERLLFDAVINRILAAKGVRYWTFESNGPKATDPPELITMIGVLCTAGIITPAEARELAGPAFGRVFDRIDLPWTRLPLEWFKAQMQPPPSADELAAQETAAEDNAEEVEEIEPEDPPTDDERKNVRTVNDVRRAMKLPPLPSPAGDTFIKDLDKPDPPPGAGLPFGGKPGAPAAAPPKGGKQTVPFPPKKPGVAGTVKKILEARAELEEAKAMIEKRALDDARKGEAEVVKPETLTVPDEVFSSWFAEELVDE